MSDINVIIINSEPFVSKKYVCAVAYTIQKIYDVLGRVVPVLVVWDEELKKFSVEVDSDVEYEVIDRVRDWIWKVGYEDYVHVSVMPPMAKGRIEKLIKLGEG